MSKLRHGRVHPCRRPVRQPQAGRPCPYPRKSLRQLFVRHSAVAGSVVQKAQCQRTVDIDSHLAQVSELSLDVLILVLSPRPGQDPVESRKASEVTAEGRTILCSSVPHRPPSESVIDSIDPVDLARTPAQDVPKERVSGFGRVLGSERSLDLKPVIVVQVLLPFVGQSHQEPVLDFLALRQRAGLSRSLLNFGWRTPGLLYEVIYVTPRQQPRRRAEPARPGHRPGAADRGSPGPAGSASPPPPARSPPSVESSGHHASA